MIRRDVSKEKAHRRYLPWLFILLFLFTFRVSIQLFQYYYDFPIFPPFESWHSGTIPYRWLLASQAVILYVMAMIVQMFSLKTFLPIHRRGRWLFLFGGLYLSVMLLRFVAGLTVAEDHPWFGKSLPAFFHIVLATFVLLVAHFDLKFGKELDPNASVR